MNIQLHNRPAKSVGSAMALTDRDVQIVKTVAAYQALTRDQIQRHHRFGSTVRANATLLRLVRHGYLTRRFQPTVVGTRRAIYILGPRGIELISGRSARQVVQRRSDLFVHHQLMVNDVRLAFSDCVQHGYTLDGWTNESELHRRGLPAVGDGYVEYTIEGRHFAAFIEADRGTEGLSRWNAKTTAYLDLAFSGLFERSFRRQFFRVLVVAEDAHRAMAIGREIGRVTNQIFWLTTLPELLASGPFASIWIRPRETNKHSLTES